MQCIAVPAIVSIHIPTIAFLGVTHFYTNDFTSRLGK